MAETVIGVEEEQPVQSKEEISDEETEKWIFVARNKNHTVFTKVPIKSENQIISFDDLELYFPKHTSFMYDKDGSPTFVTIIKDQGYEPPKGGWTSQKYHFRDLETELDVIPLTQDQVQQTGGVSNSLLYPFALFGRLLSSFSTNVKNSFLRVYKQFPFLLGLTLGIVLVILIGVVPALVMDITHHHKPFYCYCNNNRANQTGKSYMQ